MGRRGGAGWVLRAGLLLFLLSWSGPGWAAERSQADLFLRVDPGGGADVVLSTDLVASGARLESTAALQRSLEQALGGTLRQVELDRKQDALFARCDGAFRRHGWRVEGEIDPAPLAALLRSRGTPWLTVTFTLPAAGFTRCPGAELLPAKGSDTVRYWHPVDVGETSAPLRFAFGYRAGEVWGRLAPLVLLLLTPIGLTLVMRRAALRAVEADRTAVWFGYWRFLRFIGLGIIPLWMIAGFALHADDLLAFALGRGERGLAIDTGFALFIVPPVGVMSLCNILSQPVFARVRGMEWTQRDLARQSAGSLAAILVPTLLLHAGLNALIEGTLRPAMGYFAAAIASSVLLQAWGQKVLGMTPNALTAGELRDRVFALAEKAGVKVRQVYVLPGGKGRLANAFAMRGDNVLFTDYLLAHMSKREVDAVVAHELAHLKRRDPRRLLAMLVLVVALASGGAIALENFGVIGSDQAPWMGGILVGLSVLLFYFFTRRFERAADAGAVALTGDPEGLITALVRLMRLNLLPVDWGKWDERLLTHPSTLRRVEAIAQRSGVSPERLQELLSLSEVDDERYPLPAAVVAEEKVFSTLFKSQTVSRISWSLTAVMALTPAVVMCLARWMGGSAPAWAVFPFAVAATLGLYLAVANVAPLWGYRDLQRRLRAKLEQEGIAPQTGVFVGFAPASVPRLYESFTDWDVGLLFLAGGRLAYVGEQTCFALRREQIVAVRASAASPSWWRGERVCLEWRGDGEGEGGTFSVRPGDARSLRQLRRDTRAFAKRLRAWWEGAPESGALPAPLEELESPVLGEVTSASPRAMLSARAFLGTLVWMGLLAAGAAVLFGLSFELPEGDGWCAILAALLAAIFQWVPLFRYREPGSKAGVSA